MNNLTLQFTFRSVQISLCLIFKWTMNFSVSLEVSFNNCAADPRKTEGHTSVTGTGADDSDPQQGSGPAIVGQHVDHGHHFLWPQSPGLEYLHRHKDNAGEKQGNEPPHHHRQLHVSAQTIYVMIQSGT